MDEYTIFIDIENELNSLDELDYLQELFQIFGV